MAQQDDMPKKKPGTESRLTMVPGSYAAPCCSEGHPGGARGLPECQPFSQFTLGHQTCRVAQSPQNRSCLRPGWGEVGARGCAAKLHWHPRGPPATHMQPSSCLATERGVWDSSRSLSDWEAVNSFSQLPPSFISHFCLGVIHFLSVTALLFSIL